MANPERFLPDGDRNRLHAEDVIRDGVTIGELVGLDRAYASADVELVEAELDDDPPLTYLTENQPRFQASPAVHRFGTGNQTVAAHMRGIAKIAHDRFGVRVLESPGWTTRGRSSLLVPGFFIAHHTAAQVDVTNLLIHGRPDLAGPLCNFELRRDGTLVLIASGRANHAGVASVSSSESYGMEVTGPIPITARGTGAFPQYRQYCQVTAAVRLYHGWPGTRIRGHKEIAQPDGRKPDPAFGSVAPAPYRDMDRFRTHVAGYVTSSPQPSPQPPSPPAEVDDLAGEGPAILGTVTGQLKPFVPGQPDFHESNEALWDHVRQTEAKVDTLTVKVDQMLAALAALRRT